MTATANFTDLNDDTRVGVEVFSAYIQDQIAINDYFDIVLGARFDSFAIDVFNVPADDLRERTDEEISPRLGLIFKPKENVSIYGSFSESFLPRSGEQFTDINGDDDQLDPNIFQNLEAGLKWDFSEGLSFTAAIFEIEQSSPQVADDDPDTLDVIDTTVSGFETQILGNITDDWFVSAGYSYLDGDQDDEDLRPRELPENTFNIWSRYQLTDQFGLGAGLTYQDESFADNGNNVTLPSFTRIDAAVYYDVNEDMSLQVNIENLFDTEYFPNSHTANNISVGAPLNAKFTVSGRF